MVRRAFWKGGGDMNYDTGVRKRRDEMGNQDNYSLGCRIQPVIHHLLSR